jgi:hypothetical protein
MNILEAIHRYAETCAGGVKPLSGEFEELLRLRVGNHRVLFDETADTITIHRIRDRRDAYGRPELPPSTTGRWPAIPARSPKPSAFGRKPTGPFSP